LTVGLDAQQLLLVVPLVDGLRLVEALVALQADEARAGRGRGRLGELRLADACRPFDEHRLAEPVGKEDDARDVGVGQIVDCAQSLRRTLDGVEPFGHGYPFSLISLEPALHPKRGTCTW